MKTPAKNDCRSASQRSEASAPSDTPERITGLIQQAHELAHAVAPELQEPFYILTFDQIPADLRGSMVGYTSGSLCYALQPELEKIGQWRGPGAAIALNIEAIQAAVNLNSWPNPKPEFFEEQLLAVVLHELVHVLIRGQLPSLPTDAASRTSCRLNLAAQIAGRNPEPPTPWGSHGLDFIRAAVHLCYRANAAGWRIHTTDAIDGESYRCLSGVYSYLATLLNPTQASLNYCIGEDANDDLRWVRDWLQAQLLSDEPAIRAF